jgi:hypothetical protein
LQLCACFALCVADGYKTHKNKTMTIPVKDWVAWWIVIPILYTIKWKVLPNVWIPTICLLTPTSTSHFFVLFLVFQDAIIKQPHSLKGHDYPIHHHLNLTWASCCFALPVTIWLTQGQNINRFKFISINYLTHKLLPKIGNNPWSYKLFGILFSFSLILEYEISFSPTRTLISTFQIIYLFIYLLSSVVFFRCVCFFLTKLRSFSNQNIALI